MTNSEPLFCATVASIVTTSYIYTFYCKALRTVNSFYTNIWMWIG